MIYLTGDTHGTPMTNLKSKYFPEGKTLTKDDYVIILGDFGVLWKDKPDAEEKYQLDWLGDRPYTCLFIDGNHENFNRLYDLPSKSFGGGDVGVVSDSVYHLRRGQIYNIDGNNFFTFGGASSIDKMWRTPGKSWWEEEIPSKAEFDKAVSAIEGAKIRCKKIDYVLTHTCPNFVKKYLLDLQGKREIYDETESFLGHFDTILDSYKHWYFGHFHQDRTIYMPFIEEPKFTCLYSSVLKLGEYYKYKGD